MASIFSSAVSAIVLALNTPTPVAPLIEVMRLRVIPDNVEQAVVVRIDGADVISHAIAIMQPTGWRSAIAVECYARFDATTTADIAIDNLLQAVAQRLMQDPTLGGVVISLRPESVRYEATAAADNFVCATISFSTTQRPAGQFLT